jgi:NAD(P)-dependent dehydrogenase (short-subunit alcohol dehydrogenase family)
MGTAARRPSERERLKPICIIAGAGSGLGPAVAERYACEGFSVYTLSQNPSLLAAEIERLRLCGLRVVAVECDLAKPGEVDRQVRSIEVTSGPCDVFVYNALVEGARGIDVENVSASVNTIVGPMQYKGGGAILLSVYEGPGAAALRAFIRGFAKDTEAFGIRLGIITFDGALPTSITQLSSIAEIYWEMFFSADYVYKNEVRIRTDLLGGRA